MIEDCSSEHAAAGREGLRVLLAAKQPGDVIEQGRRNELAESHECGNPKVGSLAFVLGELHQVMREVQELKVSGDIGGAPAHPWFWIVQPPPQLGFARDALLR